MLGTAHFIAEVRIFRVRRVVPGNGAAALEVFDVLLRERQRLAAQDAVVLRNNCIRRLNSSR